MNLFIRSLFGSKIDYVKMQENLTISKTIMRQNAERIVVASDPGASVLISTIDMNMPFSAANMTELFIYYNDVSNNTTSSPWKPTINDTITSALVLTDPTDTIIEKTFKRIHHSQK